MIGITLLNGVEFCISEYGSMFFRLPNNDGTYTELPLGVATPERFNHMVNRIQKLREFTSET